MDPSKSTLRLNQSIHIPALRRALPTRVLDTGLRQGFASPGELIKAPSGKGLVLIESGHAVIESDHSQRENGQRLHTSSIRHALERGDIWSNYRTCHGPRPLILRAITAVRYRWLDSHEQLQAKDSARLAAALNEYAMLTLSRPVLLPALAKAVQLHLLGSYWLNRLLDRSWHLSVSRPRTVLRQGWPGNGFWMVRSGVVESIHEPETPRDAVVPKLTEVLGEGELFGDLAMLPGRRAPLRQDARAGTELFVVPRRAFLKLSTSEAFRRRAHRTLPFLHRLERSSPSGTPEAPEALPFRDLVFGDYRRDAPPEVLWFHTDARGRWLSALMPLLAQAMAGLPQVMPAVVIPLSTSQGSPRSEILPGGTTLFWVNEARLVHQVEALRAQRKFTHVLVDGSRLSQLPEPLRPDRLLSLSSDPSALPLPILRPATYAALLPAAASVSRRPGVPYPYGTVRLRFGPGQSLMERGEYRLSALPVDDQQRFHRWARGVTGLQTGVALGGGGALAGSHLALLEGMAHRNMPIDMVSGVSAGALVGAFYCSGGSSGGVEQVHQLLEQGCLLNLVSSASIVNSYPVELFVNAMLKCTPLEQLELPFFPVATDVAQVKELVLTQGNLGLAVRASCSFPGTFGPTLIGAARCVDGGFVNNCPASVLAEHGVNEVVASSIINSPPPTSVPSNPLCRLISIWNPLLRIGDIARSGTMLFQRVDEFTGLDVPSSDHSYVFQAPFEGYNFWDFNRAIKIAEDPAVQSAVNEFLDNLQRSHAAQQRGGSRPRDE